MGDAAAQAAAQAAEPALSTLAQTVLGALLIIAVFVAVGAIYVLVRVQNARVADQKEMSDKLGSVNTRMIEAFSQFRNTLSNLDEAQKEDTRATYAMRDQVNLLSNKIEHCPTRGR